MRGIVAAILWAVLGTLAGTGLGVVVSAVRAEEAPPAPVPSAAVAPEAEKPVVPAGDPYAGLPKIVAKAVRELQEECETEDGTFTWKPETVYAVVKVSPDGRPDYLIDTHTVSCDGGYTPWVGSDGFRHILFVSIGPGRWTRAFDRGARGFMIVAPKGGGRPRVEVFSHSAYCTRPNPERYMRCTQLFEWRGGKLKKISETWFTD